MTYRALAEDYADIEDEQYPCDECEYYAIHLNDKENAQTGSTWRSSFLCSMFIIPITMRIIIIKRPVKL